MQSNSAFKTRVIAVELSILVALYGVIFWILVPRVLTSSLAIYLLLSLVLVTAIYYLFISPLLIHGDTLEKRGLGPRSHLYVRTDNFSTAWWSLFIPFTITSGIIIFAAWQNDSPFFVNPDWYALSLKFSMYLFSAFAQDILFFSFILIRLKELVTIKSDSLKSLVVLLIFATLFALFHLPNVPLMLLSFIFALTLGHLFYRVPNLYVIVIMHAFLGTLLHRVYELHMKLGVLYGDESQQGYVMRHLIPYVNELIENRW